MRVLIWVLACVIILMVIARSLTKEHFVEPTVHDCKGLMAQRFGYTQDDFDRMYTIDLSSKINVDKPQCKKYEKINIGEVLMDMKANVVSVGPDGRETNDGTCVLPIGTVGPVYPDVSTQRTTDEHGYQKCTLYRTNGDPYVLTTNILNKHGEHYNPQNYLDIQQRNPDENVYWGCKMDPTDPKFQEMLTELFYSKNKAFFNDLQREADTCFRHEEDKIRYTNTLNTEKRRKDDEQTRFNNQSARYNAEQQRLDAQASKTNQSKVNYEMAVIDHNNAIAKYNDTWGFIQNRQGWDYAMYEGYWWEDVNFVNNNSSKKYASGRLNNFFGTWALPQWGNGRYRWEYLTVEVKGYFKPNATGIWRFFVNSDDAAYMWIGNNALPGNYNRNNAIVSLPGLHGGYWSSQAVELQQNGMYPIRILHGNNQGGWDFAVGFEGPGVPFRTAGNGFYFSADF